MIWLLGLLIGAVILELLACYLPIGWLQKILAGACLFVVIVDSLLILGLRPAIWSLLILYLSIFRVINLVKLIDARKQKKYLRSSFSRTSLVLAALQLIVFALMRLNSSLTLSHHQDVGVLVLFTSLCLVTIGASLSRGLKKTKPKVDSFTNEAQLPTLSIAIPARNETVDLDECLSSLIESDYPKLEILVLDDCSQEKRTPEIIRQYAHDGVRFLAGQVPDQSWTAKNYAYEQLAAEANGDIILFCGVDTRFERTTVRKMVELKLTKRKTMVSFMPVNSLPSDSFKKLLLQPVRYLWELGIPRRSFNRPPVLSTCWLMDKKVLSKNGSFKAVSRSVLPERYFARQSAKQNDGYSFVCLGQELGLFSKKSFIDQKDTAIRTRYPLLKQRIESVTFLVLAESLLFILPVIELAYGLLKRNVFIAMISLINIVLAGLILFVITRLTYNKAIYLSALLYPVVIAYDIYNTVYSMWAYEFSEVVWKGRNVCIPVMQIVTRPPTLSSE